MTFTLWYRSIDVRSSPLCCSLFSFCFFLSFWRFFPSLNWVLSLRFLSTGTLIGIAGRMASRFSPNASRQAVKRGVVSSNGIVAAVHEEKSMAKTKPNTTNILRLACPTVIIQREQHSFHLFLNLFLSMLISNHDTVVDHAICLQINSSSRSLWLGDKIHAHNWP